MPRNRFRSLTTKHKTKPEAPAENAGTQHNERLFTMKLRNLLLTAALLLVASTTYAKKDKSIDEEVYNIQDFSWTVNTSGNGTKTIHVNLVKDGQEDYNYAVYDVAKYDSLKNASDLFTNTTDYVGQVWVLKSGDNTITLPAGVNTLGVVASNPHQTFSSDNATEKFMFYREIATISNNTVSYGKLDDKGGGNHAADVTFGQPLPAPVATLLIALGFGAAFVMYRNRKQAKA